MVSKPFRKEILIAHPIHSKLAYLKVADLLKKDSAKSIPLKCLQKLFRKLFCRIPKKTAASGDYEFFFSIHTF